MITLQEVYDTVKAHLLRQNTRSLINRTCAYRGAHGAKCAVGVLIQDAYYDKDIEGCAAFNSEVIKALRASDIPTDEETMEMLFQLQMIHDKYEIEEWPDRIEKVAVDFELVP
jgi:glycerol dehydrogenase-like iron-containing ADH family enzyme